MAVDLSFVSAPTALPVVSVAMADERTILADGFTLGSPTFEAEPDSVGGVYGWREVSFTISVRGSFSECASLIQSVTRQLLQPRNWLMMQWSGADEPMFLRTYRTAQEALDWEDAGAGVWRLPVSLVCDPWIYGSREDLPAVTVNMNPAAATTGCFFDVANIKGDFETAARITVNQGMTSRRTAFGLRRRGDVTATPFLLQAESMTNGTDTTTHTNDATASGSGSNYKRCTFTTTATNDIRVSSTWPSSASTAVRGEYRVYGRMRRSVVSGAPITLQLQYGDVVYPAVIMPTAATANLWEMVDLGQISVGTDATYSLDGETAVAGQTLELWASKTGSAVNLDFDYFVFVPADDALGLVSWGAGSSSKVVMDGASDPRRVYGLDGSGNLTSLGAGSWQGGPMMLSPNQTNRVFLLKDVMPLDVSAGSVAMTETLSVSVSYWPKYLHMRPSGS